MEYEKTSGQRMMKIDRVDEVNAALDRGRRHVYTEMKMALLKLSRRKGKRQRLWTLRLGLPAFHTSDLLALDLDYRKRAST